MITDDSYTKQVNDAYEFLKMASPQQLAAIGQQVQKNPNSPEAMALAMATQYQQQAKQNVQPPQGTILSKQLAALQQPAGIPNVGPNQMALQQAAAQNPNMAGIAAAPENMPLPQGAATGGLVSFAHGGEVRGFTEGGSSNSRFSWYNQANEPEQASPEWKAAVEKWNQAVNPYNRPDVSGALEGQYGVGASAYNKAIQDLQFRKAQKALDPELEYARTTEVSPTKKRELAAASGQRPTLLDIPEMTPVDYGLGALRTTTDKGVPDEQSWYSDRPNIVSTPKPKAAKIQSEIERHHNTVANAAEPATPHETAGKTAAEKTPLSLEERIQGITNALHMDTPAADALREEMQKRLSGAENRNMGLALMQGLGAMLASPTPYIGQAAGRGLMIGANAYQEGQAGIDRQRGLLDELMLHPEETEMANRRLAMQQITDIDKQKAAALAKMQEQFREHKYKGAETEQQFQNRLGELQFGSDLDLRKLASQQAANMSFEQFKNTLDRAGKLELEQFKLDHPQLKPEDIMTAITKEMEATGSDSATAFKSLQAKLPYIYAASKNPLVVPTPAPPQQLGGGLRYTPPQQ